MGLLCDITYSSFSFSKNQLMGATVSVGTPAHNCCVSLLGYDTIEKEMWTLNSTGQI